MLQAIVAIVVLANFVLAGIVGVRLLRMPSEGSLSPERLLGWYLTLGIVLGGLFVSVSYGIWSSQGRAESTGALTALHAAAQFFLAVGYMCVIGFTWRTFHRDAVWARRLVAVLTALLLVSLGGRLLFEGFAIRVDPGAYHWLAYVVRLVGLGWMSGIAFYYWRRMRKRLALGLADPMVVNRFALWGLFAVGNILSAVSEPIARVIYHFRVGDRVASAESITQVGGSIIETALLLTTVSVALTVVALFLTFFPTKAYGRWVVGGSV
jgi:hypothetical protein